MKKLLSGRFFFISLCFVVFAVIYFPYHLYSNDVKAFIEQQARSNKVLLSLENLQIEFPGTFSATGIAGAIPSRTIFPIPFQFERGEFRFSPLALLLLNVELRSTLFGYDGEIVSHLKRSLFGGRSSFDCSGKITLERYPAAFLYGIKGVVTFDGKSILAEPITNINGVEKLVVEASLKSGAFKLPQGGELLPAFENIDGAFTLEGGSGQFQVKKLELHSPLGTFNAQGPLTLSPTGETKSINLSGTVNLSEEGKTKIGGYLLLASGSAVDQPPPAKWQVTLIQSEGKKPQLAVRRTGS